MSSRSRSMRAQCTHPAGLGFSRRDAAEDVEVGAGRGTARVSPSRRLQRPSALPCAAPAVFRQGCRWKRADNSWIGTAHRGHERALRPNRVRGVNSGLLLASALVTCESAGGPLRGEALSGLRAVGPAALAWENGTVTYAGPTSGLPGPV